jgi:iron complex transport system ATP-binding protein
MDARPSGDPANGRDSTGAGPSSEGGPTRRDAGGAGRGVPGGSAPVADPAALSAAVADVSTLGGYFALEAGPVTAGWRPLAELYGDADAAFGRIAEVAGRLGTDETRVAASIWFQGLAARLWSPPLATAVAHGLLVELERSRLCWRDVPSGPLPLRAARLSGRPLRDTGQGAAFLYRVVVTECLEPLAASVRRVVTIAPGLLWGNAASALAGAVQELVRQRPALTGRAVALARVLLATDSLRGTGELAGPAAGRPFFTRRSCCLYYRLPGGGMCADCALLSPPSRPHDPGDPCDADVRRPGAGDDAEV